MLGTDGYCVIMGRKSQRTKYPLMKTCIPCSIPKQVRKKYGQCYKQTNYRIPGAKGFSVVFSWQRRGGRANDAKKAEAWSEVGLSIIPDSSGVQETYKVFASVLQTFIPSLKQWHLDMRSLSLFLIFLFYSYWSCKKHTHILISTGTNMLIWGVLLDFSLCSALAFRSIKN